MRSWFGIDGFPIALPVAQLKSAPGDLEALTREGELCHLGQSEPAELTLDPVGRLLLSRGTGETDTEGGQVLNSAQATLT